MSRAPMTPFGTAAAKDPNHVYSEQELQASAAKKAMAKRYLQKRKKEFSAEAVNASKILSIPEVDQLKEKNDFDHRNYCGPAATKIIMYTWTWNLAVLPTMNEIGQGEQIDPTWGVFNWRVRDYLNNWLSANVPTYNWDYVESTDSTKADLKSFILWDIDANRGLESALWTQRDNGAFMNGWNHKAKHIVAIRGYETTPDWTQVYYVETGQAAQGYSGPFHQDVRLSTFFKYVNAFSATNNSQVW
jgi:hypothetical protein